MARVLVTRALPAGGLDPLLDDGHDVVQRAGDTPYTHGELTELAATVDAVVCLLTDRIDAPVLEAGAASHLRVVANVAVGYDNIDVAAARKLGVAVCNTPGVLDETTADVAFLLVLAASRLASEAERDLRSGAWAGWGINQYLGNDVHGATLGLVGYGRIGRAVARRASGFGMQVLHHTRHPTDMPGYVGALDDLLAECDVLSVHVPLGESTRHLIGARELALLRPHAVVVNTARGPVVDEEALADALHAGTVFAAGLDVYEDEPTVHPRLLERAAHGPAPPHRQCQPRHPDPDGARGVAGGVRRAGGAPRRQPGHRLKLGPLDRRRVEAQQLEGRLSLAQRTEDGLFLVDAGPAGPQHVVDGGRAHHRHPVGVTDEPVPRRHGHATHVDGGPDDAGTVLGRAPQRHGGGEHGEAVGGEGTGVADAPVDDEAGHAPRLGRGGEHLSPVPELLLVPHVDGQRAAARGGGHGHVDGEVVAGTAAHGKGGSGEPGPGPHGTDTGAHGAAPRLAHRRRPHGQEIGGTGSVDDVGFTGDGVGHGRSALGSEVTRKLCTHRVCVHS